MTPKKVVEDMERSIWGWAAALLPLMQELVGIVLGLFRRLLLALLGGVPAEHTETRQRAAAEQQEQKPTDNGMERSQTPFPGEAPRHRPRWRERLVRECLRRVADGEPLRERHLAQLPGDVRAWLLDLRPEDAHLIKHLPDRALRDEHTLWMVGGEMIGGPRMDPPDATEEAPAPTRGPRL